MPFHTRFYKFQCLSDSEALQVDQSGCAKPPVDIDVKVAFLYMDLIQNATFTSMSNGGFAHHEWVTPYSNVNTLPLKATSSDDIQRHFDILHRNPGTKK